MERLLASVKFGVNKLGKLGLAFAGAFVGRAKINDLAKSLAGLVETADAIDGDGADDESNGVGETAFEQFGEIADGIQHVLGFGGAVGTEEVRILEPDNFFAAEKREGTDGLERAGDGGDSFGCVGGSSLDDFSAKFAGGLGTNGNEFPGSLLDEVFLAKDQN